MCVVSMIMDHYSDEWGKRMLKDINTPYSHGEFITIPPAISKEEIAEFRRLLERAREYDRKNNEPDCELQEKKDLMLKLAKELGVEIDFL